MAEFVRPHLYDIQRDAIFCTERWALIEASTKSGKTVGCIAWILEQAFAGRTGMNYWWVAPVSDQARIAFTRVKQGLTRGTFTAPETPTPRIILMNGAVIWFKSADNADSLYGEDVYAAVIDEASRCKADAWYAVRSTLTATRGACRIIGNVKGRKNWFYDFARRCERGDEPNGKFTRITVVDAINAGVISQEELEDARRNLPENVFRELYMAEAADDGGNPFGLNNIEACARPGLAAGPVVAWGIDLAKHQDFFVCIGLNEHGEVAGFSRWRHVPWRDSIRRVWQLVGEDTPALVDSTGVGDPVLEELQVEHGNFVGFNFTPASKQKIVLGLAVSIQSREISFPRENEFAIKHELESFEYITKPTGAVVYSAPEGQHDDTVMALALARQMWVERAPGANFMEYVKGVSISSTQRLIDADKAALAASNRPWRTEEDEEIVPEQNELSDIYEETLRALQMERLAKPCPHCKLPVTGSYRVSDGTQTWHPQCTKQGALV